MNRTFDKIPQGDHPHKDMKPKKKLKDRAFFRTITGRNKTGKTIFGILDSLPMFNFHEVIKAVAKEKEETGASVPQILKESMGKLDVVRTLSSVATTFLIILGAQWTGVDLETAREVFEWIKPLFGG
jgi:hypothetical protein